MPITIAQLQAEHHESGFGIGASQPRLSWRLASEDETDWTQAKYEIVITRGGKEEFYSAQTPQSTLITWPSKPLASREIAHVKARVAGTDGVFSDWASITIEVALLDRSEWKAKLVSSPIYQPQGPKSPFRVRKVFQFDDHSGRARLYATAHGLYEVEINGKRVGDHVLAPGWQSYSHHLNYQTYDVTSLLKAGENVIGAHVGEGWYAGRIGRPGSINIWGDRIGFMGQVEVDGNPVVWTDETWEYLDSPTTNSEIYNGETFNSLLDDPSWSTVKSTSVSKGPVTVLPDPKAELISPDAPPVRRIMTIDAVELITTPSGKQCIDFGQNLVGWVRIQREFEGKEMVIRFAEVMENGELGTRPLRTAKATDTITLGGKIKNWEPKFTFHGFRYIEVTGVSDVQLSDFVAIVVSSDLRRTGDFHCSHKQINQLYSNVIWSMRGNFLSVPTDCPQRDERLGWTGDIQVFTPTANYIYDTCGFLSGWLKDLAADQSDNAGIVPLVIPAVPMHDRPAPLPHAVWADSAALTPWDLYTSFGDQSILERQFESMSLWLDKGLPRQANGLWSQKAVQYGDWLDPRAPPQHPAHGQTDPHLTANAYLVHTTGVVAKVARLLGKSEDAKRYESDYQRLRNEFQQEYVSPKGRLTSDTQTAIALALRFNLVEGEQRKHALERIDYLIRWDGFRISTGFAGTPIILNALADNGLLHLAYRMLQEGDNPSWLYPVSMGATTIWERWDSMLPNGAINPGQMTSFNHYALGAVAAFLHDTVGGLSPIEPGWKTALVKPQPGGTVTSASTSFDSPYGLYAVSWSLDQGKLNVEVKVPPNGHAKVVLPGKEELVGSGTRTYTVDWTPDERWPPKLVPGPSMIQLTDEFIP